MEPRNYKVTCLMFMVGCLVAFILQIYFFSPISDPDLLSLPSSSSSFLPENNHLQKVIKLGEGVLRNPEDVCFDKDGILYTCTHDGWIRRLHKNGTWEDWKWINSTTLLGLTATKSGDIIICDTVQGLFKVNEEGVTHILSYANGSRIWFADDVIEGEDGSLYFSIASTKFGAHNWYLDMLEVKPHGQLLKYNPLSNETSIVLDDLGFTNGVAISMDQTYLLVCETWKFRCLKYWLTGDRKGKTEVFIDNLPGGPDNINLAPDGSFWIALIQLTRNGLEFVHTSKVTKHIVAMFPKLTELVRGTNKKATVVNVDPDGHIIRRFDDPEGKVMSFVTSAVEHEDHLYLGSLNSNFVGKLPLK